MASNVTERASSRKRKTKRDSLVIDNSDDDGYTEPIIVEGIEELIEWMKSDPVLAWNVMKRRFYTNEQLQEVQELQNEVTQLRAATADSSRSVTEEYTQMEEAYQTLQSELKAAEEGLRAAEEERNYLAASLRYLGVTDRASPATTSTSQSEKPRLSAKTPDAPMFSDGKTILFKDWEGAVKNKLAMNADHYPTVIYQLTYLRSRCEGKALRHVNPRMRPEALVAYKDVNEAFKYLESVFHDPNRTRRARDEYISLKMSPQQDFSDFLATFQHLAEESN